jgi:hypothetical protein
MQGLGDQTVAIDFIAQLWNENGLLARGVSAGELREDAEQVRRLLGAGE